MICFGKRNPEPSEIDRENRRAASQGSFGYAMAAENADYNGHAVEVRFKPAAVSGPIWNAGYWWGGRRVLGRGSLDSCLKAAMRYLNGGQRGASVVCCTFGPEEAAQWGDKVPSESLDEQIRLCEAAGLERLNEA